MVVTRYFEARNDDKVCIIDDSFKNFCLKEIISLENYKIRIEWQLFNYKTTVLNTIFSGASYIMINVKPFNTENLLAISCDVSNIAFATYVHNDILTIYILRIGVQEDHNLNDAKYVAQHTKILHYVPSEKININENYGIQIFNKNGNIVFNSACRYLKVVDAITQDIKDISNIDKTYSYDIAVIPFSCRYTASYNPQIVFYRRHFFTINYNRRLEMTPKIVNSIQPMGNALLTGYFYNTNLLVIKKDNLIKS